MIFCALPKDRVQVRVLFFHTCCHGYDSVVASPHSDKESVDVSNQQIKQMREYKEEEYEEGYVPLQYLSARSHHHLK